MPKWAMLILAVWLCLVGLSGLLSLSFQGMNVIMGVLALIAGVLLLLEKPWQKA